MNEVCGNPNCQICHKFAADVSHTQKVRGIQWANLCGYNVPSYQIFSAKELAESCLLPFKFPVFARPCPMTPRHGFVESRIVDNWDKLGALAQETVSADPDSEIVTMPYIDAEYSAIYSPGKLVMGPGNDGATSGKNSVTLPIMSDEAHVKHLSFPCHGEYPYVEMVDKYIVQVRGGPAPTTADPTRIIKVSRVEMPNSNLLKWEKLMRECREVPGIVVWHPGGNELSHYAVHARLNGIPVVYGDMPEYGSLLATVASNKRLTLALKTAVLEGLSTGQEIMRSLDAKTRKTTQPAITAAALVIQNSPKILQEYTVPAFRAFGAACSMLVRVGAALVVGELRHFQVPDIRHLQRDQVYSRLWQDHEEMRNYLYFARIKFARQKWARKGSYGGPKWASCARATIRLDKRIRAFTLVPSQTNLDNMAMAGNNLLAQVHNGGWWLDKVCSVTTLDEVARGDIRCILDALGTLWQFVQPNRPMKVWGSLIKLSDITGPLAYIQHNMTQQIVGVQVRVNGDNLHFQVKLINSYKATNCEVEKNMLQLVEKATRLNPVASLKEGSQTEYCALELIRESEQALVFGIHGTPILKIGEKS